MGKNRPGQAPPIVEAGTDDAEFLEEDDDDEPQRGPVRMAAIHVPVLATEPTYEQTQRRVDLMLSGDHIYTMASIRLELYRQHATLKNGNHVESNADVVRWFLEQVRQAA